MAGPTHIAERKTLPSHPALWRASDLANVAAPSISSGFDQLDEALPGGGWPAGALTELLPAHEGIGELRLLGPALARLSGKGERLAWVAPPHLPYAPALAAAGIDIGSLVIVRTRTGRETLWATEQALASNACGAVLAWLPPGITNFTLLRRLQLAAERSCSMALLFRSPAVAREPTPAVLRIALDTLDGGLALRLLKRRGAPLDNLILIPALPGRASHALDRHLSEKPAARNVLPRRVLA